MQPIFAQTRTGKACILCQLGIRIGNTMMIRSPFYALLAALAVAGPVHSAEPEQTAIAPPQSPHATRTVTPPSPDQAQHDRYQRARRNLEALGRGAIMIRDLGAQDLQDVLDFDRMVRGGALDNRSFAQRCVDSEVQRLNGRPTELAWRVIELKCREIGN